MNSREYISGSRAMISLRSSWIFLDGVLTSITQVSCPSFLLTEESYISMSPFLRFFLSLASASGSSFMTTSSLES